MSPINPCEEDLTFGEALIDLLKRSVLVQSIITLMLIAVACCLWLRGVDIPQDLRDVLFILISFWMGSKVQHLIERPTSTSKSKTLK